MALEIQENMLADVLGRLAAQGHSVEPASALSVAGLELARQDGLIDAETDAVAIITSAGANWTVDIELQSSSAAEADAASLRGRSLAGDIDPAARP